MGQENEIVDPGYGLSSIRACISATVLRLDAAHRSEEGQSQSCVLSRAAVRRCPVDRSHARTRLAYLRHGQPGAREEAGWGASARNRRGYQDRSQRWDRSHRQMAAVAAERFVATGHQLVHLGI